MRWNTSDDNGGADLTFVKKAIKQIIYKYPDTSLEIVIKSTVPPGTVSKNDTLFKEIKDLKMYQ